MSPNNLPPYLINPERLRELTRAEPPPQPRRTPSPPTTKEVLHVGPTRSFSASEASGWAAIGSTEDCGYEERCALYAQQTAQIGARAPVDEYYAAPFGDSYGGGQDGRWDGEGGQKSRWNVKAKLKGKNEVRKAEKAMEGKSLDKWRKQQARESGEGSSSKWKSLPLARSEAALSQLVSASQ